MLGLMKAGPPSASWMSASPELLSCLSHVSLGTGDGTRVFTQDVCAEMH